MKKLVSAILAFVLTLSLSAAAFASESFKDVASSHWAYEYIEYAASANIVNGMGNDMFEPEGTLTVAQFITIMTRAFYADEVKASGAAGKWYAPYVDVSNRHGLMDNLGSVDLDSDATRYQMAQIIYNTMLDLGWEMLSNAGEKTVLSTIPDGYTIPADRLTAVTNVYDLGIIAGMDTAGTFAGNESMTRAQASVVYCRMDRKINGSSDPTARLTVASADLSLGMSTAELTAAAGTPDDKLETFAGYTWYVYGTDTYDDFFMAGVYNSQVAALCSAGSGFSYMGYTAGTTGLSSGVYNNHAQLFTDKNDGGILHMVFLADWDNPVFASGSTVTDAALEGESKVIFYLTNAFRHYHGREALAWSSPAAKAAELHSQDMADKNYFSHTSADGRTPWERMKAQGISYRAAAENIIAGYSSGILAYNGWVNSSGHRSNILSASVSYLGVGFGYNSASSYRLYATQDFYV